MINQFVSSDSRGRGRGMQQRKTTKTITFVLIMAMAMSIVSSVMTPVDVYAAPKSKAKSYKKFIKSHNKKTQKIAKRTPAAKKWAKKTKSYYKKSKKTSKVKTLKKLRTKSKKAYTESQILDYRAQIKKAYENIKSTTYKAPSLKSYLTQAENYYKKSKKSRSIKSLKLYTSKIKGIDKTATNKKTDLTWHDAEYRYEYVEGHYKTVVVQPAKYELMLVSYFVWLASDAGFKTGDTYDWDLKKCKENGCVFPLSYDKDEMLEWGIIAYSKNDGSIVRILTSEELGEYINYLLSQNKQTQRRETVEWFQTQEEITEQKWIEPYTKKILVRAEGWY